jgi:hypothetical protein
VCILKLGKNVELVNVLEISGATTQELVTVVQDLCEQYNVARIFMDRGGGGKAVCDLLEEGYNGKEPILDISNEANRGKAGRHILEMIKFTPNWITDANFTTLALLEDKRLLFPERAFTHLDKEAEVIETIKRLKSQMLNIIVTQTSSGVLHFDTPKKSQKKDLYSAIILAAYGVRVLEQEMGEDAPPPIHEAGGLIRGHHPGAKFDVLENIGGPKVVSSLSNAIPKRKI